MRSDAGFAERDTHYLAHLCGQVGMHITTVGLANSWSFRDVAPRWINDSLIKGPYKQAVKTRGDEHVHLSK